MRHVPPVQEAEMQQRTSAGSLGHAPLMEKEVAAAHEEVGWQVPVPAEEVQASPMVAAASGKSGRRKVSRYMVAVGEEEMGG